MVLSASSFGAAAPALVTTAAPANNITLAGIPLYGFNGSANAISPNGLFTLANTPGANGVSTNVAPDMIAGKLVLIGTSAVGLNDIKTTPVSRAMPGVEIHAQVLETTLAGDVISQPIYGIVVEFVTAILFGLLVITFAPLFGPVTLVALGAAFATILAGMSVYFYTQNRLLIDFTYPLIDRKSVV